MQKEHKSYAENDKRRAYVPKRDVNVNEDKTTEMKEKVKVVGESSRSLSFRERMRGLSPHRRPLKDRMRDKTVSYVDLLRPDPPPSRRDDEISRRLVKRK